MATSEEVKFCDELYEKSKSIHDKSDRLVQLKLGVALTDVKLYRQVLYDFYCIFKTIEESVKQNIEHPLIQNLWLASLERSKLFEKDLEYFTGLGWREIIKPSDAALQYVSHIQELSLKEPELLLAYIHTMYLAIFSGGRIIRGIVKRTLGISGPDGLEMFDIPEGYTKSALKSHIKETMNAMSIDRGTKDRIIQEKIDIFRRNNLLVATISPNIRSFNRLFKLLLIIIFLNFIIVLLFYRLFA